MKIHHIKRSAWKPQEIQYLKRWAGKIPTPQMARNVKKSVWQVDVALRTLKIGPSMQTSS